MTEEEFRCELEALITEREGMIALNKQREAIGASMAYDEASFCVLADRFRDLAKAYRG